MEDIEPHEVLGVSRGASEEEVRDAYREMVKEHHPDVSDADDAEERFVRIRDAYEAMRERAEKRAVTGGVNGATSNSNSNDSSARGTHDTTASTKSEHKRKKREKRKRWEDPWETGVGSEEKRADRTRADRRENGNGKSAGREHVESLGYGWTLFRRGERFFVSREGGRGRVYVDGEGRTGKEKTLFSDRSEAEAAYEKHIERRDEQRRTIPLGDGWSIVKNAGGYAVEGRGGYLGSDGEVQDNPYWFVSPESARRVYESRFGGDDEEGADVTTEDESLASRVTVGAALVPFLVTVTVLNIISSVFGLGTRGKNPYISTATASVVLGSLAVFLNGYLVSYVLLFLAVWTGVEFVVMVAGPYTIDEMEG